MPLRDNKTTITVIALIGLLFSIFQYGMYKYEAYSNSSVSSVRITLKEKGTSIEGVAVHLFSQAGRFRDSSTTDKWGEAFFETVRHGTYNYSFLYRDSVYTGTINVFGNSKISKIISIESATPPRVNVNHSPNHSGQASKSVPGRNISTKKQTVSAPDLSLLRHQVNPETNEPMPIVFSNFPKQDIPKITVHRLNASGRYGASGVFLFSTDCGDCKFKLSFLDSIYPVPYSLSWGELSIRNGPVIVDKPGVYSFRVFNKHGNGYPFTFEVRGDYFNFVEITKQQ